ncbi:MAG: DegT/DnrJ/EryC1/StrS family aminotransferase [Firmicutes bacterium]|nr:DegT/DnrJ/EryC1/StrS family aminotransferase [Bacillota bacterium]
MAHLAARGIGSQPYFPPVNPRPLYRKMFSFRGGELPVTEDIARRTLALPFYTPLSEEQVAYVCEMLADARRII